MAVAFQISEGHVGYNLDQSEEALLVDAFLKVKAVNPKDPWFAEVERNFFDSDRGVSARYILVPLNERLARIGEPPLTFASSNWTPYMRLRYEERIQPRQHLRVLLSGEDRAQTLKAAAVERAALSPATEAPWWPQPAAPKPEDAARQRAAISAHLANEGAPAKPVASNGPNALATPPTKGLGEDGVTRILRVLGGIEARLSAIEAMLGLAQANGRSGPLDRVAAVEHTLDAQLPPPAGDGTRQLNGNGHDTPGAEAQPPSPPVSQDVSGRYVFAPGDAQPF
ncbi:hypothetical protein [Azospirillum doebereinerae]